MKLAGVRALITGTARGIGAALAPALRRAGCDVIACTRDDADIADPRQVNALAERVGPVDLLINNAATIHDPAPLWEIEHEEWKRLLDTNVLGMVSMLRAFVPAMNARGSGVVVNVSSTWGRVAAAQQSPYCATKFAVEALTASLAAEVAPGVCVIAVNPGVVATDMLARCFQSDVSGFTPPDGCAGSLVSLLGQLDPVHWNGRSLDADAF